MVIRMNVKLADFLSPRGTYKTKLKEVVSGWVDFIKGCFNRKGQYVGEGDEEEMWVIRRHPLGIIGMRIFFMGKEGIMGSLDGSEFRDKLKSFPLLFSIWLAVAARTPSYLTILLAMFVVD